MDVPAIEAIIAQIPERFASERLAVWKSQVIPRRNQWLMRVFLDRAVSDPDAEGAGAPIGHLDCVAVSRFLTERLEAAFGEAFDFALEVSSPGAERPLETPTDFRRFRGKRAQVTFRALAATSTARGVVGAMLPDGSGFLFTPDGGAQMPVPFADLRKAHLVI